MSKKEDGGPAFPERMSAGYDWSGMFLRDWFAGQALAGHLAWSPGAGEQSSPKDVAKFAYDVAAAMLAERSKSDA